MPPAEETTDQTEGCKVKPGEVAAMTDKNMNCELEEGATLSLFYQIENQPEEKPTPKEASSITPKKALKEYHVPEVPNPQGHEAPAPAPAAPAAEAHPAPVAEVPAPAPAVPAVAGTVQPDPTSAASEIAALKEIGGGNSTLTIALALIAVVGGAAGWKFWNKFSEQKHEQKMKQMEIDAQEKGLGNAQPIPCQTVAKAQAEAIAQMKAQVEELQGKVSKVEKKSLSMGSFDADDLEEWQKKVDKELKSLKAAKSRAGGA